MALIILAFAIIGLMDLSEVSFRALDGMMTVQIDQLDSAVSTSNAFLKYRSSLITYVENHPTVSGTVALGLLGLSPGEITSLSGADNTVIRNGSTVTVEAWSPMSSSEIAKTVTAAQGDLSIGAAAGSSWSSPLLGSMGSLPVPVDQGNIVTLVTLAGSIY
ncbi:type IV pilus biogenesis protein PilM [Acetobacter sp. TBRC 12305]|uniref:Type IV pilus biogenesis protein PilM n=1 Tax=Acetobacter garciniae TaxID=2817435 RepID=A0A939HR58_9PROT|nr:type IV pilus biogenesis protein PilM [Acetobacter garciniae]MBO1326269.1 type IV pilus biogenesis protein PilM [Acetobacter garciniae]MBX0345993.1 type IV pilus biogenesis protein PilM [Acetobacter garciniae]